LDYNFTAKVEHDFDEIAEGNVDWAVMMKERSISPNQRCEANAERVVRNFRKDPKTDKQILFV
jgi:DNA topoisomerase-1